MPQITKLKWFLFRLAVVSALKYLSPNNAADILQTVFLLYHLAQKPQYLMQCLLNIAPNCLIVYMPMSFSLFLVPNKKQIITQTNDVWCYIVPLSHNELVKYSCQNKNMKKALQVLASKIAQGKDSLFTISVCLPKKDIIIWKKNIFKVKIYKLIKCIGCLTKMWKMIVSDCIHSKYSPPPSLVS